MNPKKFQLYIRKEGLKFSSAHMTVFRDGTKEPLHGHNYITEIYITLRDISLKKMVSFYYFKKILASICNEWDDRVLIAKKCPFLEVLSDTEEEFEFLLCKKRYVLPKDEVALLDLENISVEWLADLFCQKFLDRLDPGLLGPLITGIQIKIEETSGQGALAEWLFEA